MEWKGVLPSGQSPSQGVYQVRESSVETTVTLCRSVGSLLLGCTAELQRSCRGLTPTHQFQEKRSSGAHVVL